MSLLKSQLHHPFLLSLWHFIRNLASEFADKKCQRSAAALTYMTLFALVPMMTVTYSMFSVIPAFDGVADSLQTLIFQNFLPETGSEVQKYLADFSAQARSLTLPGIGMLVVTAYLMLTNIEKTFNTIWGVEEARRGLSSFLLYWAVLSIGPIFLGAGLVMSTYLLSLKFVVGDVDLLLAVAPIFRVVPLFMASIAFTLLFAAVPNCRVPLRYAVIGGIATAICFELAKFGFATFVANSTFQLIYGAFAVVPLFLLWINFLWMIILLGAVFVRTLAEKKYYVGGYQQADIVAVLLCLGIFKEKAKTGDSVDDKDCIAAGIGLVHWQSLRSLMVKNKWITVTDTGSYALVRDLRQITVWDIAKVTQTPSGLTLKQDDLQYSWFNKLYNVQHSINTHAQEAMNISVDDILK
ncbi:YihY family inner membrane protein [Agarilytica rhodophyticola]|uniref:YihY family inner membrane protein n=1 Tax=Agarilytica rhodophyticola TaxID=1737490 RepID=UPI000B346331|nr:YihY family inner membrane protein [Agarilytica rhodophyticola]